VGSRYYKILIGLVSLFASTGINEYIITVTFRICGGIKLRTKSVWKKHVWELNYWDEPRLLFGHVQTFT